MKNYDFTEIDTLLAKYKIFEKIDDLKKGDKIGFETEIGKIIVEKIKKKEIIYLLNKKEITKEKLNNLLSKTEKQEIVRKYKVEELGKNTVLLNGKQIDKFYSKERIINVFEFRDYKDKKQRKKLYKELPDEPFTGKTLVKAINKVFNNPPAYDVFLTFTMLDQWGF